MKDETKAELDYLFQKKNIRAPERRRDPRAPEFEAHMMFLDEFSTVQDEIIRPMMVNFGRYLENKGHRYFIESAQELFEGYLHPIAKISFYILLNSETSSHSTAAPSFSFRSDHTRTICAYQKMGISQEACAAVGRYGLKTVTTDLVESHLKKFVIEAVLS
jgi:hypothetical protein